MCYQSDAVNTMMNNWLKEEKSKDLKNNNPFGLFGSNILFE